MGAEGQAGWGPQVSRPETLLGRQSHGLLQVIVFRVTSWALEGSLFLRRSEGKEMPLGFKLLAQPASTIYPPAVWQVF